jgi:hypothetical protein
MKKTWNINNLAAIGVGGVSVAVLGGAVGAAVNHEIGNLAALVTAQIALLALFFVPPVLADLGDRQTLSVYRAMYLGQ